MPTFYTYQLFHQQGFYPKTITISVGGHKLFLQLNCYCHECSFFHNVMLKDRWRKQCCINHCCPWTLSWLCWGLTSLSTIFQSCRDGAIASWVINQYFRGVKCLAQGHNTAEVGLEPRTSRSGVRHSTTEPPRSPEHSVKPSLVYCFYVWFPCFQRITFSELIHNLSLVTRKPVFGVFDQVRLKMVCSANVTS